jgi:hypothetical protein
VWYTVLYSVLWVRTSAHTIQSSQSTRPHTTLLQSVEYSAVLSTQAAKARRVRTRASLQPHSHSRSTLVKVVYHNPNTTRTQQAGVPEITILDTKAHIAGSIRLESHVWKPEL